MELLAPVPPDGGWGWVIVFCSFFINAVTGGVTLTLGVLYVSWLNAFGSGKSETSWVVSITVAVMYIVGPFAAGLALKIGYRAMALIGAFLMAVGFFLSSFAKSLYVLMITLGLVAGTGFGFAYLAAVAMPAFYFDKKRSMAMGLSTAGIGAGMFLLAPLLNWIINMYGWRGTMLWISGITLNVSVAAALMRPLKASKNQIPEEALQMMSEKDKQDFGFVFASADNVNKPHGRTVPTLIITGDSDEDEESTKESSSLIKSEDSLKPPKIKKKLSFAESEDEHVKSNKLRRLTGESCLEESDLENDAKSETASTIILPAVTLPQEALLENQQDESSAESQAAESRLAELVTDRQTGDKEEESHELHPQDTTDPFSSNGSAKPDIKVGSETGDEQEQPKDAKETQTLSDTTASKPEDIEHTDSENGTGKPESSNTVSLPAVPALVPQDKTSSKDEGRKKSFSFLLKHRKSDASPHFKSERKRLSRMYHRPQAQKIGDKGSSDLDFMLNVSPSSQTQSPVINISNISNERELTKLERKKRRFSLERSLRAFSFARAKRGSRSRLPGLGSEQRPTLTPDPVLKTKRVGGSLHTISTIKPKDVEIGREFRSVMELHSGVPWTIDRIISNIKPKDVYLSGSMYNMMTVQRAFHQSRRSLCQLNTEYHRRQSYIKSGGDISKYRKYRAPKKETLLQKVKCALKTNIDLMKDWTFLLFALSNFLTNLSLVMPTVFMVDRAISFGISKQAAAMLISLNGAGTICGRVVAALFADRKWMNRLLAYITALTLAGIATCLSPLCGESQVLHGLYAYAFGLLTGQYGALCACVLVDLKGLETVGQSYGLLLMFMGFSTLLGTPCGGLIYDLSGNYRVPFILHGFFIVLSGLILVPLLLKQRKRKDDEEEDS